MENGLTDAEDISIPISILQPDSDNDQRLYFVPFRWWKDAQDLVILDESEGKRGVLYSGTSGSAYVGPMKLNNNIFNSDLVLNLKKEEDSLRNGENGEVGVQGGIMHWFRERCG